MLNERQLNRELDARGLPCDDPATIIATLLRQSHPAAVGSRLQGDWVFEARRGDEFFLVRDATGLRQVGWCWSGAEVVWGVPGDLAVEHGPFEADPSAVQTWLAMGVIPAPATGWRGIWRLAAGHYLHVREGRARVEPWWSVPIQEGGSGSRGDLGRWAKSLVLSLQVAVRDRVGSGALVLDDPADLGAGLAAVATERGWSVGLRTVGTAGVDRLEALCRGGPAVAPSAAHWLAALEGVEGPVISGAGGAAVTGASRLLLMHTLPAVPNRLRRHLVLRGAVEMDGWVGAREAWAGRHGPRSFGPAIGRGLPGVVTLDRLWWAREELLPSLAAAASAAGATVSTPWLAPEVERVAAQIPAGLMVHRGRAGSLAREIVGAGPVRRGASTCEVPVHWLRSTEGILDSIGDLLQGSWSRERVERASGQMKWRLSTLCAWRSTGTVR